MAALLSAGLVATGTGRVRASGQGGGSNSNSNSGNSSNGSDSSKGSGDSSNSSKGTSDDSGASSKSSEASTQNSPKNSTDYFAKGTSDESSNSRGGHIVSIALAVVAVGATVAGAVVLTSRSQRNGQQQATAALAAFMRQQHAVLARDVTMAGGPVLDAWGHDLRLTAAERRRLQGALEGSAEQGTLLDALDGPIDERRAERFAAAFLRVTDRALGRTRTAALVARAARATGGG